MQRNTDGDTPSRTEAIRTQIQPSKPKWEITNISNSQNTKENIH